MAMEKAVGESIPDWLAEALQKQTEIQATLAEAVVALKGSQPPRVINFGDPDYQAKLARDTKVFKNRVYQNAIEADPAGESDETIELLTKLKPGVYLGGQVQVMVSARGDVNFQYKNKTIDQRMALKDHWRSLGDLVAKVWAEMQASAPPAA